VIRPWHRLASVILWFWIILELTNGLGHTIWTVMQKSYTPGIFTAPLLFLVSLYLFIYYLRSKKKELK
jgi:hypothetical protein